MKTEKTILLVGTIAAVGAGGYYLYKRNQEKLEVNREVDRMAVEAERVVRGIEAPSPVGENQGTGNDVVQFIPERKMLPIATSEKCGGIGYWPMTRSNVEAKVVDKSIIGFESTFSKGTRSSDPIKAIKVNTPNYNGNYMLVQGRPFNSIFERNSPRWDENRFRPSEIAGYDAEGFPAVAGMMHNGDILPVIGFRSNDCPNIGIAKNWVPIFGKSAGYIGGIGYNKEGKYVGGNDGWWIPASISEPWLNPKKV